MRGRVHNRFSELREAVEQTLNEKNVKRSIRNKFKDNMNEMGRLLKQFSPRFKDEPKHITDKRYPKNQESNPELRQHGVKIADSFKEPIISWEKPLKTYHTIFGSIYNTAPHAAVTILGARYGSVWEIYPGTRTTNKDGQPITRLFGYGNSNSRNEFWAMRMTMDYTQRPPKKVPGLYTEPGENYIQAIWKYQGSVFKNDMNKLLDDRTEYHLKKLGMEMYTGRIKLDYVPQGFTKGDSRIGRKR